MSLAPGHTLTHYEILGPLGAGGMGEVYRARDTRLEREVAIKVLPEHFADDEERLRRFEREAKTLASLNHPNVAGIHGIDQVGDTCFLSMELVPGEDLAAKLARGPLPLDEAADLCRQIAEGLEAAHEAGVVHRDLKPANIRITPDGVVKILDFGLAKPIHPRTGREGPTAAESDSFLMTEEGLVLGTPTYMSPEQARGRSVDRRTDIWAFGCVLFECVTGRRPFVGESLTDVLAAIVEREPDWTLLPERTPPRVRELLQRCLEKDVRVRLRDVGEARVGLSRVDVDAPAGRSPSSAARWPWMAATVVSSLAFVVLAVRGGPLSEREPEGGLDGSTQRFPRVGIVTRLETGSFGSISISPDGLHVAYDLGPLKAGLVLHALSSFEPRRIEGAGDTRNPTFSADGRELAYFDDQVHGLCTTPVSGGSPRQVLQMNDWMPFLWLPDGSFILAGAVIEGRSWRGLALVDRDGRVVRKLTTLRDDEKIHASPLLLPGGRWIVFTVMGKGFDLGIVPFEGGEHEILGLGATPQFVEPDLLLSFRPSSRRVDAVRFDARTGERLSEPWSVLPNVERGSDGVGMYAVAANGTLVYVPADPGVTSFGGYELVWSDGQEEEAIGREDLGSWTQPRLSPDGTRLLVRMTGTPDCSLWLFDLERGSKTRLTLELDTHAPLWHPDEQHVLFSAEPDGGITQVMIQPVDGSSPAVPLRPGVTDPETPSSVSVEGELLAFTRNSRETGSDVWVVPLAGGEPQPFAVTRFDESDPSFSPDGRWIAYGSNETGTDEIYVRAWPSGGGKVRVSVDGGAGPHFSRDGERLYFGIGSEVWVADVEAGETFQASIPRRVFHGDFELERARNWDVSADGTRAVFVRGARQAVGGRELRVVYGWADTLRGK